MEKHAYEIKAAIASFFGVVGALLGWFGILVLVLAALMMLDWISGSWAAKRAGEWTSARARDGVRHKMAIVIIVLVAGGADIVLGLLVNMPYIPLPFTYTVLFCPMVVVWYVVTEMGSIIENAVKMGASCPTFLRRLLKLMKVNIDDFGQSYLRESDDSGNTGHNDT